MKSVNCRMCLLLLLGWSIPAHAVDLLVITADNRIGVVQDPNYRVIRRSGQLTPSAGHTILDLKSDPSFFDLANVLTHSDQGCFVYEISLRESGNQMLDSSRQVGGPAACSEEQPSHLKQRVFQTGGAIAGGNQLNLSINGGNLQTLTNASGTGAPDVAGFTQHIAENSALTGDYMLDRGSDSLVRLFNTEITVVGSLGVLLGDTTNLSSAYFSDGEGPRFGPMFMLNDGRAYELDPETGQATDRGELPPDTRVMAIDIHAPQRRESGASTFDGGGDGSGGGSFGWVSFLPLLLGAGLRRRGSKKNVA